MKYTNPFVYLVVVWLLAASCSPKTIEVIADRYQDGSPKVVQYFEKVDGRKVLKNEVHYYKSGEKKMEGAFKNGHRSGLWKSYYRNGNVWSQATYREGREYGQKTVYYENGQIYYQGQMIAGQRVGKWVFIDEDGKRNTIDYDERR